MKIPEKKKREILSYVRRNLKKFDGKLVLEHKRYDLEPECDEPGFFEANDNEVPSIKVAIKDRDDFEWLTLVLHEYSHFNQWKNQTIVWERCSFNGVDAQEIAENWISNKLELKEEVIHDVFESLANCEYDAEMETINLVDLFGIDKYGDLDRYIRQANAYIASYRVAAHCRQWFPQCWNTSISARMPNQLTNVLYYETAVAFYDTYPEAFEYHPIHKSVRFWHSLKGIKCST